MNVILFAAFFLCAAGLLEFVSAAYQHNWNKAFDDMQAAGLRSSAYLLMDDMKQAELVQGPFTVEQREWLTRRTTQYRILAHYSSPDGQTGWFDNISAVPSDGLSAQLTLPLSVNGRTVGNLTVAKISSDMDPLLAQYHDSVNRQQHRVFMMVLAAALIMCLGIARAATSSLRQLQKSANAIRAGNRDVVIRRQGAEEIRQLASTLRELFEDLKQQENLRNNLMEDLAHELFTPLTSLLWQTEAMIDGVYETNQEQMVKIHDELMRLIGLLRDLQSMAEAESARFALIIRRTDMNQLARAIYHNYLPMAQKKGIKFSFAPAYIPVFAEVDQERITRALSNIVVNAIKYTNNGGNVKLTVSWNNRETFFICEDTGIGIRQENLSNIFIRLYRVDKSRSRVHGGVGLGLHIAKTLAEAHHGRIEAESEFGQGSVFRLYIPNLHHAQ